MENSVSTDELPPWRIRQQANKEKGLTVRGANPRKKPAIPDAQDVHFRVPGGWVTLVEEWCLDRNLTVPQFMRKAMFNEMLRQQIETQAKLEELGRPR